MVRWDYRVVGANPHRLQDEMNALGEEGFRAAHVFTVNLATFVVMERKRPPEAKEPIPQPKPGRRS